MSKYEDALLVLKEYFESTELVENHFVMTCDGITEKEVNRFVDYVQSLLDDLEECKDKIDKNSNIYPIQYNKYMLRYYILKSFQISLKTSLEIARGGVDNEKRNPRRITKRGG